MSSIPPPNWLASVIQGQGAQNRAAIDKQREAASDVERTGKAGGQNEKQNTISTDDEDSQVFTDSEGAGSQGREDALLDESVDEEFDERDDDDDDGAAGGGLDVSA